MLGNILQTAVVTAVIFAALFIFQGQKPCGRKMMMNDKTKKEWVYSIWVHIWKLDKGVDLLKCCISSWQIAILLIHRRHVWQILQQHHCSYVSCNDDVLRRVGNARLYVSKRYTLRSLHGTWTATTANRKSTGWPYPTRRSRRDYAMTNYRVVK